MSHQSASSLEAVAATLDPIDVHIGRLRGPGRSAWARISSQSALPIFTGIVLGPQGIAVLTPEVLTLLSPSVPVAMALLGVTVALAWPERDTRSPRTAYLFAALIVLSGLGMAWQLQSPIAAAEHVAQAAGVAVLLAAAGWILSARGAEHDERRVFSIATFLLLGGVADYLAVSALLLGWTAAAALRLTRLSALVDVRRDASYLQHAVTALLLIIAGARVVLTWQIVAGAIAAASLVAAIGTLIHKPPRSTDAADLRLPAVGALGVALAMDAARFAPQVADALSFIVVAIAALDLLTRRRESAST